jgi:ABC-2 type transport system permease protein
MKLALLFVDELRGFYKSKVMLFLWVGLPIIAILFRFVQSSATGQDIPFTVISSLVVSSLAGTLASVMLAVSLINEKNRHVYDLFLIRPLKRQDILLAKYFSVFACVAIASFISVIAGLVTDYLTTGALSGIAFENLGQSLAISLSMIAIACAAGVLIGVASPSVLVGAILVIYGGNQISVLPLLPTLLNISSAVLLTLAIAVVMAAVLLAVAFVLFERKQF